MSWIRYYISIRTKMIIMVVGILILAIAIAGYLIRGLVYQNIVSQKMTTADILTASLVHDIKYEYEAKRPENVRDIIAKFMTYYRIIQKISFYNPDIVNIADSNPGDIGKTIHDPDVIAAITMAKPTIRITRPDWSNLGIRSVGPIFQGSKIVGAITMDIAIHDIQLTLSAIDYNIAMIMIITVLLTSVILFIMLRSSILLRLSRLITMTHQIAAGNYDIQIRDNGRDEIGDLSMSFDQMTSDLKRSKEEIDNYNRHLEDMVEDATAQLQKAYENLKNAQGQLVLNEKMASLGVLIAGIAHEINTPVGAILNVSRNLENKVRSLPQTIETIINDQNILCSKMIPCLNEMVETSSITHHPISYRETRIVETLLREYGIENFKEMANTLSKLNFMDQEKIMKYRDCLRIPSFFSLVESLGSIIQAAKISETSSQKISEIVRALKYYAYTDKDRSEMTKINDSIKTALILLRSKLKHAVTVSTDFAPDLPAIPCTSEIHQVWTNLLTNACDAIGAMGEDYPGKISIRTCKIDENILVTVTDNGIGIPEDKIGKIFDPFFTTKDIGKGTGLGLSIVSGILKKHNGTIGVKSSRGCTVFEIALSIRPNPHTSHNGEVEANGNGSSDITCSPVSMTSGISGDNHVN